jgi:hypothetical protein
MQGDAEIDVERERRGHSWLPMTKLCGVLTLAIGCVFIDNIASRVRQNSSVTLENCPSVEFGCLGVAICRGKTVVPVTLIADSRWAPFPRMCGSRR